MKLIIKIMKLIIKAVRLIMKIMRLTIKTMKSIMKIMRLIIKTIKSTMKTIKYKSIKKNQHNFDCLKKYLELFSDNEQFFIEFYFSILIIYEILKLDF